METDKYLEILLAALLHDIDDKKFFKNNINNENAKKILHTCQYNNNTIELVINMINLVSYSDNKDYGLHDDNEWMLVPRYADRLDAIGYNGIKRCYQYAMTTKLPLYMDSTVRCTSIEEIDTVIKNRNDKYNGVSNSMIDHYYDKLLHIPNYCINNTFLLEEMKQRKHIMVDFVLYFGINGNINKTML
jgi:uncharacterized protein